MASNKKRITFICDNPNCPKPDHKFTENVTGALRRKKNKNNYCSNKCKFADEKRARNEYESKKHVDGKT
jgi:hypothetical protein